LLGYVCSSLGVVVTKWLQFAQVFLPVGIDLSVAHKANIWCFDYLMKPRISWQQRFWQEIDNPLLLLERCHRW
jgi:hypothetical protein